MDQTKTIAMTSQPTVVEALREALEDVNGTLKRWENKAIADIALGLSPDDSQPQRIWNNANERRRAILVALEGRQPTNTQSDGVSGIQLQPTHQVCNNGLAQSQFIATLQGYNMSFANGWTVSVKFGAGNYCQHKHTERDTLYNDGIKTKVTSRLAEIAAWDANKKWYKFEYDEVEGWQTADQVADFIDMVRKF